MKEISVPESKEIMKNVLCDVAKFCDKNNIVYYLAYGTLIGAIRHNGFIPWDDDIDIMMPRPDYERFVDLYHKEGRYGISSPLVDKGCFLFYSKVYDQCTVKYEKRIDYNRFPPIGIDIDVFPLDGMPSDIALGVRESKKNSFLCELLYRSIIGHSKPNTVKGKLSTIILNPICRAFGKDFFIKKILKNAKKHQWDESEYVHVVFPENNSSNERYNKQLFENRIRVLFEGEEFWAPEGYDTILKNFYGDYMQLPPEEKRITHHSNKVFWK